MGFGLVIRFSELLELVTTSKEYALSVLQTGHNRSSQSVTVLVSHCLVTDPLLLYPQSYHLTHLTAAPELN
jgi:hypothetical protein